MSETGGSEQLRSYRRLRREGTTMATACVLAGISMGEARLIEAEDLRNPPSAEALEPITPAAGQPQPQKEDDMARPKKQAVVEEVHTPDYDLAVRIYRNDIKPAASKQATHGQELSQAYKDIRKRAYIQPQAAKLAFKLDDMEESKRDDFLRSLNGLLKRLNIFMPADLVDAAEGKGDVGDDVIPTGERRRPQLASVPVSDGIDADLAGEEGEEHAEAAE